jgi:hypothetical protein
VLLIAAASGSGKATAAAEHVAQVGSTCWLSDLCEDVAKAAAKIREYGGAVGEVVALHGKPDGIPNCLHPDIIEWWQKKGFNYRQGFCPLKRCCERQADPDSCPFLWSIDLLKDAPTIAVTKALARRKGFFSSMGNAKRHTIVLDEDPIGLHRQTITISRTELAVYLRILEVIIVRFVAENNHAALAQARNSHAIGKFCWEQMGKQPADGQPKAVDVPADLRLMKAVLKQTKKNRKQGRKALMAVFHKMMRKDPVGTVRNVCFASVGIGICLVAG